jgi:NhaP-type Na+/H+ or K+/H+ antiporter
LAALTLLLVLMAATVVLAPVAERMAIPYPVLLLMFGLVLAFVPGLPLPTVKPELLLPLVLPPLLFAAARRTSWREFLDNRRPIALLAVALVAVTAFAVGFTLQALVPGLPLIAALALGAAVAPPMTGAFSPWHGSTTLGLAVSVGTDTPGRGHHVGDHRIAGDGCGFRLRRPGAACRGQ